MTTTTSTTDSAVAPPVPPPARHSITERDLAYAVAEFMAGSPFSADGKVWRIGGGVQVTLFQDGDSLTYKGHAVFSRTPLPHMNPSPNKAGFGEVRALFALVIREEHHRLYGSRKG